VNAIAAQREISSLYEAHADWLRAWLGRHTRCSHRAADLTQDTFRRLLERPHFTVPDTPRSYLATVARRLLIDDIRRREIEQAVIDVCQLRQPGIEDISPERIAEATQLLHAVLRLLDTLPLETRSAFLLRRIEGLEQKDIGISRWPMRDATQSPMRTE
jgi:RNA polymerase sigma factor (sigma-70 family)